MNIKDVAVFINAYYQKANQELKESFPPIRNKLIIDENIFIDKLPSEVCRKIYSDCKPKGFSDATPQFGQLYSFIRDNAPESPPLEWDSDERLQLCIALSRIIHPTTINFEYSARIKYENDNIREIIPGPVSDFGAHAWVTRESHRNWLTENEGKELAILVKAYNNAELPKRVKQALWILEYVFRTYYIDIRWPLICIGLESLIHTDKYKSTKQFSCRVSKLAKEVGKSDFTEIIAEDAYTARSTVVHGQLINGLEEYKLELYEALEEILRLILKKSILNNSFAYIFSSTDKIKERWPID